MAPGDRESVFEGHCVRPGFQYATRFWKTERAVFLLHQKATASICGLRSNRVVGLSCQRVSSVSIAGKRTGENSLRVGLAKGAWDTVPLYCLSSLETVGHTSPVTGKIRILVASRR